MPVHHFHSLVIIILPPAADAAWIARYHSDPLMTLSGRSINLIPFYNTHLLEQLSAQEQCLTEADFYGKSLHKQVEKEFDPDKEVKKLEKKGWSQGKIKKWLDEKEKHTTLPPLHWRIWYWEEFFSDVLEHKYLKSNYIGILCLRFSNQKPEDAAIAIKRTETISIKDLPEVDMSLFEENVRYNIIL